MSVQFHQIPSNVRVPLFYAEVDPSHANTASANLRGLLIGGMLAAGSAAANTPEISAGVDDAKAKYGQGSVLAQMAYAYRQNDPFGEVWCLPLADAGGGTAATGTLTITGPATAAGMLSLYLGGIKVAVPVANAATAATIATAVAAAINGTADLAVTATAAAAVVTVTAKNKGATGNDIDLRANYQGAPGGELLPAGVTVAVAAMANGATNPILTQGLANLQDMPFEFIACAYTDTTSLAALKAFLDDTNGRWSWQTQIYGHAFIAYRGTFGSQTTFGLSNNDRHLSALGLNDTPSPMWKVASALAAQAAISVRADQAQPIRGVPLIDVLAPPLASRFSLSQRNTLLFDGISTAIVDGSGTVILEMLITTYQTNALGSPDTSFLDAETLFNLAGILRTLKTVVDSKFGRSKLAADGTRLIPGTNVATPAIIRAELIAAYREMEDQGFTQQSDVFAEGLIVQKNAQNPNRVDVLWPGVLVDRLDVFALLAQFRLA